MGGRPRDPDYWRKWRAAHPGYRERERERLSTRRQRGDRTEERARARAREADLRKIALVAEEMSALVWLDPLLEQARAAALMIVRPDRGIVQYVPLYEDAVGEAALAIVAGDDPVEAARTYVKNERARGYIEIPW